MAAKTDGTIDNTNINKLKSELIWGNKNLQITQSGRSRTLYSKAWIEAGLIRIGDLCFKNGKLDVDIILNPD